MVQISSAERRLLAKGKGEDGVDDMIWNSSADYIRRYIIKERDYLLDALRLERERGTEREIEREQQRQTGTERERERETEG